MALQTAATANATSATNTPVEGAIFTSLVMTVVDTKISAQVLLGAYKATFTLAADVNGKPIWLTVAEDVPLGSKIA